MIENLSVEEWKNLHIESFSAQKDVDDCTGDLSWDWKDVAESGSKTERRKRLDEVCPKCGERLIEVHVSTPSWTWENLCGREGMLTFCPHCQKQLRFYMGLMS